MKRRVLSVVFLVVFFIAPPFAFANHNSPIKDPIGWFVEQVSSFAVRAVSFFSPQNSASEDYEPISYTIALDDPQLKKAQELSAEVLELQRKLPALPTKSQEKISALESAFASSSEIVERMRQVAKERRQILEALLVKNPALAFISLLPAGVIAKFPQEVQKEFEQPATLDAFFEILHRDDFDKHEGRFEYFLRQGASRFPFYPVGSPPVLLSSSRVRVSGFKIGNNIVAQVGAGEQSFEVLEKALPESVGDQKTLVILVNFQDATSTPFSVEQAKQLVFNSQFQRFMNEQSYGRVSWSGDVIGWHTLPRNGSTIYSYGGDSYDPDGYGQLIRQNGLDIRNYGRLVFLVYHPNFGGGFSGVGKWNIRVGGADHPISMSWIGSIPYFSQPSFWGPQPFQWTNLDFLLAHELGHALGVRHANRWRCDNRKALYGKNCFHQEYGNTYDTMDSGLYALHFNAFYKEMLGWLEPKDIATINQSGAYQINALELPEGVRAAKIQPPFLKDSPFYLEHRNAIGFDSNLNKPEIARNQKGLFVNWIPAGISTLKMFTFPRLLDMSPSSAPYEYEDVQDVTLNDARSGVRGALRSFQDQGRGIQIDSVRITEPSAAFRVRFTEPRCRITPPFVESWVSTSYPGNTAYFWFSVQNRDTPTCKARTFTPEFDQIPTGWNAVFGDASPIILEPETFPVWRSGYLEIPDTVAPGRYSVRIKIGRDAIVNFSVEVKPLGGESSGGGGGGGKGAPISLSLTSPVSGQVVRPGTRQTIQWDTSQELSRSRLVILLVTGKDKIVSTICQSCATTPRAGGNGFGSYQWTVPQTLKEGNYQLLVTTTGAPPQRILGPVFRIER